MKIPLKKIASILGLPTHSSLDVDSFFFDSRNVTKGGIFFALKGEHFNGHDFLESVAQRGAYAAVVDKQYQGAGFGLELFHVGDVLDALQVLASFMLKEKEMKVIAVTGSVGKTTTKEMIYALLAMKYKVHTSKGSFNTKITLPITILEAKGDEDYLLLEMGMTKKGQIKTLTSIAPPTVAVLTQVTYCHSENFDSLEEIAEAKAEIFLPSTEFAVIHEKSAKFDAVYRNCFCKNVLYPSPIGVLSPYKETHFSENFCAAYQVAKYLGMSDSQIRLASLTLAGRAVAHRFQKIVRDGILFVDDSYNANSVSTLAAIENLPSPEKNGRKILVFGEMKELGGVSLASHQIIAEKAVKAIDIVFCIGKSAKIISDRLVNEGKPGHYFYDYRTLREALYKEMKRGDVVLLKGANCHKLWKLLETLPALQK